MLARLNHSMPGNPCPDVATSSILGQLGRLPMALLLSCTSQLPTPGSHLFGVHSSGLVWGWDREFHFFTFLIFQEKST